MKTCVDRITDSPVGVNELQVYRQDARTLAGQIARCSRLPVFISRQGEEGMMAQPELSLYSRRATGAN
jgi:hypothetical protein